METLDMLVSSGDLGRLGLSAALGALLGLERELAHKPAGLRTHMLVSLGATFLVLLGQGAVHQYLVPEAAGVVVRTDPIRVIQAIVVGISFLGAGTIVHEAGSRVEGLTTAASILLTAAIGIGVAVHRAALAVCLTIVVTAILFVLGRLELRLGWTS